MRTEHERCEVVRAEQQKLSLCLRNIRCALTEYEFLKVIGAELGDWLAGIGKYGIRRERHGDENTPGDLAPSPEAPQGE